MKYQFLCKKVVEMTSYILYSLYTNLTMSAMFVT